MIIPDWLIVLVILLFGIRQIFRYTKNIHKISKTEKVFRDIEEMEQDLKKHSKEFESTESKSNVIQFPGASKK